MIHPSQDCSGERAAFEEEKFLILREEFLANGRTERGVLAPLAHEGKRSNSAGPA